jgi:hypothetical protein
MSPLDAKPEPGRDRCEKCGHILLWVDGRLLCLWRACVEAEDQR